MALTSERRMAYMSPAPKCWDTGMQSPLHSPSAKPSTRKLNEPVAPTAARASLPTNWPTMMLSAMLYIC